MVQVVGVELRQEAVEPFASFFAAAQDNVGIIGGYHYGREMPEVPGKPVVFIIVEGNLLFTIFYRTYNFFGLSILFQETFQAEAVGLVPGILGVAAGKIAAGEAKIVDGIQQVGFTGAIPARNANNAVLERKAGLLVVFELDE